MGWLRSAVGQLRAAVNSDDGKAEDLQSIGGAQFKNPPAIGAFEYWPRRSRR